MSIGYDEKHKTYYCQFRYKDWQGNVKATTKRGFKTKREAKQYETNFKLKSSGDVAMRFADLVAEYLDDVKATKKNSTYYVYESAIRLHILPYFCDLPICSITPKHIRKWQSEVDSVASLGDYAKHNLMVYIKNIFKYAVKYHNLSINPTANADALGKVTKRVTAIEPDEFEAMLSFSPDDYITLALKLMFYTGCRVGELLALTKDDINGCTVTISKTYHYFDRSIGSPKTKSSERKLSIPQQLADELIALPDSSNGFLFPKRNCNPYRNRLRSIAKKAGLDKDVTLHILRHSHASLLIHNNVPISAVSKRLGHANSAITLSTYAHSFDADDENIKVLLEKDFIMKSKM